MFNWGQISSIIDRALDLVPDERITFIEDICLNDPTLENEVTHFFDSIEPSEEFCDNIVKTISDLVNEITFSDAVIDTSQFISPLKKVGPYTVINLIACGGMGNVYLAEQSDGRVERKVAIKVLRHELSSKNHIKRFLYERNILSELEHTNIARLYDDGITADGRPYMVMEFVDGMPITLYCNEKNCTLNQKLNLFKQVCQAVEFAHSNLIIHRDLKPDNILVNPVGTVKILDFGIAKILNEELTSETENLQILSIQYAAPEQITFGKITTATDIYALGLLLYEMITSRPPFDLNEKNLEEAEQIICFEVPKKPSTIIRSYKQSRKIKRDLDAIIMKGLHKKPELRYVTASQFIEGISRSQKNLPICARISTVGHHLSKITGRNSALYSAFYITALLISGLITYRQSRVDNRSFQDVQY